MFPFNRRRSPLRTTIALAFYLIGGSCWAQAPRSAQLIVAFTPGGPVDFVARLIAEPLGRELGHPVVVENRAGANGNIGAEYVAKGAAPVIADVLAERVAGFLGDLPGFIGQVKGGKLKVIAVAAPRRHSLPPDVRTFSEQGINGVESNNWYALLVPAKTPRATVDTINRGLRAALASENVRSRLRDSGAEPAASTPDELTALIKADTAKWSRIIRDKNIKSD